jgi:hypothetical protein
MQQCSNPFLDLWVGDCRESHPTQYNQYIGAYHEKLKGMSGTIITQEMFDPCSLVCFSALFLVCFDLWFAYVCMFGAEPKLQEI